MAADDRPSDSEHELLAARLAAIVVSSDDAIVSKTLDGVITSWNQAAERMFGYTAAEAVGQHITLIIPAERRAEEDDILARIRRGETVDHFETVRRAKDGRRINVSLTISPIRSGGRVVGASKVARDITDRQLQDEMRARLAAIVESSDDIIVSKTLDGVITSWNRAAERVFGYTPAEAVGRHITLIIPPERHAEQAHVLAQVRSGRRVEHFDTVRVTKDGRQVNVSLTVSPIRNAAGTIIGASKIARDITERKRDEQLRARLLAEAEAANRAKDDFLAMFGHELRNPLAAIASAASVLGVARTMADVPRPLAIISRQVAHLKRLVDDLLDAARIRAGKVTFQRQPVNLAEAVDHALNVVTAAAAPSRHVVEVDTEDVMVDADPTRLEQIILNLVNNAIKYTPAGRRIRIVVRREPEAAVLEVQDDGIGISAEELPLVFDLFSQIGRGLDRTQGGLGIGLALVRTLVELHGGTVTAHSEGVDRGSVFTVRLPRLATAPATSGAVAAPASVRRRVLIIEDNDDSRDMLRAFLEHQGHEVFEAATAAEGIAMAIDLRPDLALIDIGLPGIDGYEVARRIRNQAQRPGLLVALTGYGQPEDRRRSLEAGFDEHIVKPVDPDRLAELLAGLR